MKNCLAEIITIGDEILFGQITDTNSQWISTELDKIGIRTTRKTSVGDNAPAIHQILSEAESRSNLILLTGGLGPTKDDITKSVLANYFDTPLVMNEEVLENIKKLLQGRNRELNELNQKQALVLENCKVVMNLVGTAPCLWIEKNGKIFIAMPGVPYEMKHLMLNSLLPELRRHFNTPTIIHRLLKTVSVSESDLALLIEKWEDNLPSHIRLAYLPNSGEVTLRLTGTSYDEKHLSNEIQEQINKIMPLIEKYVYSFTNESLEEVLGNVFTKSEKTLALAESCTGGYISHLLTQVAGASRYFMGSVVAYHNEAKIELGVKRETIEQFGAVSEETAKEMAENIRKKYHSSIGIATTGVAGPNGGTEEKPVGTVWIAYADEHESFAKKYLFTSDRGINIRQTTSRVLSLLRMKL